MAESAKRRPRVREVRSSVPSRVKLMSNKIGTCRLLTWCSALIENPKDRLAQFQDNVTESDIRLYCQWPDFLMGQHYKVTTSVHCLQVNTGPDMPLDVARM